MSKSFPAAGLVPKAETRVDEFLAQYPEYDGRNTVVAIFDTGVDMGAIGLQTTSDGKPKIIDVLDATGAGDVDTSLVVEAAGGKLTLPSGKVLTLNPSWPQDGKYHVGTLAAFDLFPKLLVDRLKKERKEQFDEQQRVAVHAVQQALAQWTQTHGTTADAAAVLVKKDLLARAAQLDALDKSYRDVGPIYDAVVFFDGSHWRAALDTAEDGDLSSTAALTNFKTERQFATFSVASQFNYALNIYDEGDTLSVVCDAGAHGTHVAGIVAAHHPDQPLCHGVAPGAQIISVKIGDSRLGSMETSPALARAIFAVIAAKVDVVNMSYGEYASEHNTGRLVELLTELVDEHKIVFVCSAGNNGPALGTVGSPGGTSSPLLSVGAYVSPAMMEAEYIMRESDLQGLTYTWSSRGLTFDGDVGVNVCAPGAAITAVPNWTLNKKQLMNGTSMSSPNCAGVVALLISALKREQIEYTPYSLRRTLERTASPLPELERFAQGHGLVQVVPAFEFLQAQGNAFEGTLAQPLYFKVAANCGGYPAARGVFLRDAAEFTHERTEVNVTVTPVFHKHAPPRSKVEFERHVRLVPSKRWVAAGSGLALLHEGRTFKVLVETQHLAPGVVHTAEIAAYDAENPSRGVLFTIPVTVIKPEVVTQGTLAYPVPLRPGTITRRFVTPPTSATYADVVLSRSAEAADGNASAKLYLLHVLQFAPFVRQSQSSFQKAFLLKPGDQISLSMDLVGGLTTEFCLAQFWSALGDSEVNLQVNFHGVVPDQQRVAVVGGVESHKVLLWSDLQREPLAPSVAFNKWTQRLRPTASAIAPLSSTRDKLPRERQIYELVLTYAFTTKESGLSVTPKLPLLHGRLYESPFEAQMAMVFDDKKRYLGASDALGDSVTLGAKGTYTIRAQVRHEDLAKLERLKNMVLLAEFGIKEVTAPVYAHQDDAALGRKAITEATLAERKHLAVFIGEPTFDKLPTGAQPGDVLSGTVHYGKKNGGVLGAGRRPSGFPITYVVPPAPAPAPKELPEPVAAAADKKDADKDDEQDAVRDLLLARLQKLAGKPAFDAAYTRLVAQYPTHLPLLQAQLHHVDHTSQRATQLDAVVAAADAVIALIQQDDLARFFGTRAATDAKDAKKDKETERDTLVDALARKARALGDAAQWTKFLAAYKALEQWADVDATPKLLHVALLHDRHHEAWGLALQRLRKLADLDAGERDKIIGEDALVKETQAALDQLQWSHWSHAERQAARVKAPRTYRKF